MYRIAMDDTGYSIFTDESALRERYMGIGAILVPTRKIAVIEEALETFCARHGFKGRELSWKKCSQGTVDRYIEFVALLWSLVDAPWDFRCMVVDQTRYPLKAPVYKSHTAEEGFYRYYHTLLTRSIAKVAPHEPPYRLHVAFTSDQYPYRSDILQRTVGGAVGRALGRDWRLVEIVREPPKKYRIHQAADILLGAVTFRNNGRGAGEHKTKLMNAVERHVGKRLDRDFIPGERPFNVWFFARAGDRRWAKGSRGRVG